jgi:hypothetical protein
MDATGVFGGHNGSGIEVIVAEGSLSTMLKAIDSFFIPTNRI